MAIYDIPAHNLKEEILMIPIEEGRNHHLKGTHSHNFYEILCFTETKDDSVHLIDFTAYPIKTNNIYIIKPGQVYTMELTTEKGYLVAIQAVYFERIRMFFDEHIGYRLPNLIQLDERNIEITRRILAVLFEEYTGEHRQELVYAHLHSFITLLMLTHHKNAGAVKTDSRIGYLLSLIEKYYLTERETLFYSIKTSLSSKRLNVLARQELGFTVKQLVQQRLLLEAKRRISYGDQTFKSIAFALGFKDTSYFSRFFKQNAGITPEEFKASLTPHPDSYIPSKVLL